MIWRWMIAKCVWDEKTKLGQYRRYQSWDSLGEYRLRKKGRVKEMSFNDSIISRPFSVNCMRCSYHCKKNFLKYWFISEIICRKMFAMLSTQRSVSGTSLALSWCQALMQHCISGYRRAGYGLRPGGTQHVLGGVDSVEYTVNTATLCVWVVTGNVCKLRIVWNIAGSPKMSPTWSPNDWVQPNIRNSSHDKNGR